MKLCDMSEGYAFTKRGEGIEACVKTQVKNSHLHTLAAGDLLIARKEKRSKCQGNYLCLENRALGQIFVTIMDLDKFTKHTINIAWPWVSEYRILKVNDTRK